MDFRAEHLGLAAMDPFALKDWYMRVLGASVVAELSQSPPAWLLELPGGFWIEIYSADSPGARGNRVSGWRHLALRVQNIEAAQARLKQAGVEFPEPIKPAGGAGQILFFSDPEGNLLHLVERPDGWPRKR
ncbi:MAG: VOC family protein [Verrucomicrobia subdivision 3 bacterium]|nr:VOC family protein [Limisphaerales bacterium]